VSAEAKKAQLFGVKIKAKGTLVDSKLTRNYSKKCKTFLANDFLDLKSQGQKVRTP
jgi:hypothetical protein